MIAAYAAEGYPVAKARLTSIALMVHEVRAVVRAKKRSEKEILTSNRHLTGKHAPTDKWGKLRFVKGIATAQKTIDAYEAYLVQAQPIIDARMAKLPLLAHTPKLSNRADTRYIKKVFSANLQKRRFSFWDKL